jgi:hypothetical protein
MAQTVQMVVIMCVRILAQRKTSNEPLTARRYGNTSLAGVFHLIPHRQENDNRLVTPFYLALRSGTCYAIAMQQRLCCNA